MSKIIIRIELPGGPVAPAADQALVSGADSPNNGASGGSGRLPLGDSAVAKERGGDAAPTADLPAGIDIDWPHRLAAANRYLLEEINILNAQLASAHSILDGLLEQLGERDRGDGNAPGHCHEVQGVWDSDNGDLSGKPCAWCATWAMAKRIRAEEQA